MARKIVHLIPIAPEEWDTSGINTSGARVEFQYMRDQLRTDLAALGLKVGDIGIQTVGSTTAMLFEIHDPAATQSLYCVGGYIASAQAPDIDTYLGGTGVNVRTRAKAFFSSFASSSTAPGAGLTWLWNPDTAISRADLDYDDAVELTYTGGDFTDLTTLTLASLGGLQALSPSHATYGMTTDLVGSNHVPHCLGYDSVRECFLYLVGGTDGDAFSMAMWGPNLDPSADANEYGTIYLSGGSSQVDDFRGIVHTYAEVNAFDPGGTSREYDLSPDEDLDTGNYIISGGADDGKLTWKKVEVNNGTGGSGSKGHVKEELLVEIGIFQDGRFKLRPIEFPDTDNPVICYTESCAFWWESGARMFPSYVSYNP